MFPAGQHQQLVVTLTNPDHPTGCGWGLRAEVDVNIKVVSNIGSDVLHVILNVNVWRSNHRN